MKAKKYHLEHPRKYKANKELMLAAHSKRVVKHLKQMAQIKAMKDKLNALQLLEEKLMASMVT